MDALLKDVLTTIKDVLDPTVISVIATLVSSTVPIFRYVSKKTKEQKEYNDVRMQMYIRDVQSEIDSLKMMTLRHEILDAVHTNSLSVEDIMGLYDKYKALGGNSFITEEVHNYLNKKRSDIDDKHDY